MKGAAGLEFQERSHLSRVKTGDVDIECADSRLFAQGYAISHDGASAARVEFFDWFHRSVEVTAVSQVDLNLVRIANDYLF